MTRPRRTDRLRTCTLEPGAFAGGFLSELGFRVVEKATEKYAEKLFNVKGKGLTERLAKLRTKSYQANIYDFKKKYKK